MNFLNIIILIYHGLSDPYETLHARRLDFFNEACLGLITYFLFMYNDFLPNEDIKYTVGWAQVGIFSLNIGFNCFGVPLKMAKNTLLLIVMTVFKIKAKVQSYLPKCEQPITPRDSQESPRSLDIESQDLKIRRK